MASFLQSLTLRRKLLMLYLAVILVPLLMMSLLLSARARRIIQREVTQSSYSTLQQISNNISYHMGAIATISDTLARDTQLYRLLSGNTEDFWAQVEDTKHLRALIASTQSNADVHRVRVFVNSDHLFTHDLYNFFPFDDVQNQPWYPQDDSAEKSAYWQTTYWTRYASEGNHAVFSLVRMLRKLSDYDIVLGYLLVDVKQERFSQLLRETNWAHVDSLFIIDGNGVILSGMDTTLLGRPVYEGVDLGVSYAPKAMTGVMPATGGHLLTCPIGGTDWYLTTLLPTASLVGSVWTHEISSLLVYAMLTMALIGVTTMTVSALFTRYITQRTRELVDTVQRQGFNDLTEAMHAPDHPDALEQSVQSMIVTLKRMADESYQEKLNTKRMELQLLQAQINPHFLYNAIDAIYWKAVRQNVPDVAQLLSMLAKYFRLTLSKGRDIVTLGDEVALLRAYTALQKNRFDDRFAIAYAIQEDVEGFVLPKLTLQPLVENALIHGVLKRDTPGQIAVTIRREADMLYCEVADNGIGFDEAMLPLDFTPQKGYGLHNVNMRLVLTFGQACGLHVQAREKAGARVWFFAPAWTMEKFLEHQRMEL